MFVLEPAAFEFVIAAAIFEYGYAMRVSNLVKYLFSLSTIILIKETPQENWKNDVQGMHREEIDQPHI